MSKLKALSGYRAVKPLPRQLLGTPSRLYAPCKVYHWLSCQSMVALRLLSAACTCAALPFASMQKPAGEGTSNCLGRDSLNIAVGRKSVSVTAKDGGSAGFAGAKTCPSDIFVGLGVVL